MPEALPFRPYRKDGAEGQRLLRLCAFHAAVHHAHFFFNDGLHDLALPLVALTFSFKLQPGKPKTA